MKPIRYCSLLLIGLALGPLSRAEESILAFSDPTQPGHLSVQLGQGEVSIVGADVDQVTVNSDAEDSNRSQPRADGMRVIGSSSSFSLSESDNRMVLQSGSDSWGQSAEFEIVVPHNTNLDIVIRLGGEIEVANISGDVAIKGLNGEIELQDLRGGALVESMNGEIEASFLEVHPDRPLSFTSMNGEIEVTLPADAQANVRFRSQNGTIMTNFPEDQMVTTTSSGRAFAPEAHEEIAEFAAEMAEGAVEMAMEIAEDVRAAMADAREEMRDRKLEMKEAQHEMEAARREMEEEMRQAEIEMQISAPRAPRAPRVPRMPTIPSMAGGKVISGTLNGGGVDLQIATMNGDIVVKKRQD